ncbi:MAG: inorganic diphosphatase [Pyrinomonadaceae bacterium]
MSTAKSAPPKPFLMETYDDETGDLNVIIETPQGSRNKFNYDEQHGLFKLGGVLPAGASFPFDFGFVPQTLGGDGDPLDVLLLMDEPAFTGCLVHARLIGVIEAEQTEEDGMERNDRLIAIASESRVHAGVKNLSDINEQLVKEIEHFFISYNVIKGKEFKPTGRFGAIKAKSLVEEGVKLFRRKHSRATKKSAAKKPTSRAKTTKR